MSDGRNWVLSSVKDGGVITEGCGCTLQHEKTGEKITVFLSYLHPSGLPQGDAIHS